MKHVINRTQYGIWDHQSQQLVNRYVRPIDADYKKVTTKFPRVFNQLNHAVTAFNKLLLEEPGAYSRYEVVTINVTYDMDINQPNANRTISLLRDKALSKLSKEERLALGINV